MWFFKVKCFVLFVFFSLMNVFSISCYCHQKEPIVVTVINEQYCVEYTAEYGEERYKNQYIKEEMGFKSIFIQTSNKNIKDLISLIEEEVRHFIKPENYNSEGERKDYYIAGIELYGDVLTTEFSTDLCEGTAVSPLVFYSFIEGKSLCDTVIEDDKVISITLKKELVDKLLAVESKKSELPNSQWVSYRKEKSSFREDSEALLENLKCNKKSVNKIKNRGVAYNEQYFSALAEIYKKTEEPSIQGLECLRNQLQEKAGFFCKKIAYAGCAYGLSRYAVSCASSDAGVCAVLSMLPLNWTSLFCKVIGVSNVTAFLSELSGSYHINSKNQQYKIKLTKNMPCYLASYSKSKMASTNGLLPVDK